MFNSNYLYLIMEYSDPFNITVVIEHTSITPPTFYCIMWGMFRHTLII